MRHVYTSPPPHVLRRASFAEGPSFLTRSQLLTSTLPSRGRNLVTVPLTVPLQSCRHHVWCGLEVFTCNWPSYSRRSIFGIISRIRHLC
jgi:hypothetical protein